MEEVWKPIPGLESRYRISSHGSVWSSKAGRTLRPWRNNSGYLSISLNWKTYQIHRLVLEAFVGPCPKGLECRHLDGNKHNNRLENLRWGTSSENAHDRWFMETFGEARS